MSKQAADVLIIGAGLSGAVAARRLGEAGMNVVCLEQGGRSSPGDYRGKERDWELTSLKQWHANPNIRAAEADYPIEDSAAAMKPMMYNGVGGSTILYGAHWMRFLPSDFRVSSLDGIADDWPFGYDELAPYYDRVDQDFGASGMAGDPAYPAHADYPMPPLPLGDAGRRMARAHNELGWHWWPGPNSIASQPYQGRRACVQRSTCGYGCNEGAKASVDLTHWPVAEALGVRLITGARVREITVSSDRRATGAIYLDRQGIEHHQMADVIILAANAIGTARLLLLSRGRHAPDGLANSSGLVGKRLMMHPFSRVVGFFDDDLLSWQGQWGQSIISMEFAETDPARDFVRGSKWNLVPTGGPLHGALFAWPGERLWGGEIHAHVGKWLGRSAIWGFAAEDLPEEQNSVTLDPDLTDADGIPAPKISYVVSENSRRMLAFNVARATDSFVAAGAHDTVSLPLMPEFGWHLLGTCRMGDDPTNSVVNPWGQAHDVPNLVIVDGSTFVTGSSVNPSATTAALALRQTEHLIATRRDMGSAT